MHKFFHALRAVLLAYLVLSLAASLAYNALARWGAPGSAWTLAEHRYGLLIVSVDSDGVWALNPFTRAGDGWWFEL